MPEQAEHCFFHLLVMSAFLMERENLLAADVRSHDHDSIAKIDRAAFAICQSAVFEYLQHGVKYILVCFFNFVKKNYTVRFTPDRLCELAALFIADIAGRSANQAGNCMFFHVFRHIHADHITFIIE